MLADPTGSVRTDVAATEDGRTPWSPRAALTSPRLPHACAGSEEQPIGSFTEHFGMHGLRVDLRASRPRSGRQFVLSRGGPNR